MNNEIEIGTDPRHGHSCLLKNLGNVPYVSYRAWASMAVPGTVGIVATQGGGTVDPEGALMVARCIVHAVQDADPDGFDALWMRFVADIRAARTPAPPVTNDAPVEYVTVHDPAGYRDGLVPRMAEDTTADVVNAREAEYMAEAQMQRDSRTHPYYDRSSKSSADDVFGMMGRIFDPKK
jgi:hypothetical protein